MANIAPSAGKVIKKGAAVLMARLVNSSGDTVRRCDVSAIDYSLYELDLNHADDLIPIDGHVDIALTVANVIFDSLQTGGFWSIDQTGFNFRHAMTGNLIPVFRKAAVHFQVRYQITPTIGPRTIVRFHLRVL